MEVAFTYFLTKRAPVSGQPSTMGYACRFAASLDDLDGGGYAFMLSVDVPVTTLCPCSKEISEAGAHNQRAWLRVTLRAVPGAALWIEDVVERLERHGSCALYPLLKRPDEKYVTERAYANPQFVEDVVRDVVLDLRVDPAIASFEVECDADESIHPHNAFAFQQETVAAAPASLEADLAALIS